ncbi:hypothetical protein GCM10011390_27130 [Aureimonas endophytica]|uniref:VOC domain-containing protein n=1 Tax=Aureimonas endophytica TaxID=2027858 RepID=A0A916ZNS1_9HYPH|nr:VOC family protein [Aureimonas endophytica]GGE06592.1 hypothetical protein GCM10011390_27130 [Aureimonas endophytica]
MAQLTIEAIRLMAEDPGRLAGFFERAFGFAPVGDGRLRLGEQAIVLAPAGGAPYPADLPGNDTRFQHFAIIASDMAAAYRQLAATSGWTAISTHGPERLPEASGGVLAFKFRSPEGHPLELLEFPASKVPAPWAARSGGPCLGIDHSAISVADTARSIAFYEGLGFSVGSRQTNRGPEQARLDGLAAPRVEVTTLLPRGADTPHLELLCYRQPPAIETKPAAADDVAATSLVLCGMAHEVRDPDGHRLVAGSS